MVPEGCNEFCLLSWFSGGSSYAACLAFRQVAYASAPENVQFLKVVTAQPSGHAPAALTARQCIGQQSQASAYCLLLGPVRAPETHLAGMAQTKPRWPVVTQTAHACHAQPLYRLPVAFWSPHKPPMLMPSIQKLMFLLRAGHSESACMPHTTVWSPTCMAVYVTAKVASGQPALSHLHALRASASSTPVYRLAQTARPCLQAYKHLTDIRPCGPNKNAIRGATYDLLDGRPFDEFQHLPEHAWTDLSQQQRTDIQQAVMSSKHG